MIVTDRLRLRDFEDDDVLDVHASASDIEVVRRFPFGPIARMSNLNAESEQWSL